MQDTIDFAFHFPGWSPLIECRAILLQLRIENDNNDRVPKLLGIIMRGMIVPSERWRVATIGDWEMTGTHLPQKEQKDNLFLVCKELYKLFSTTSETLFRSNSLQENKNKIKIKLIRYFIT